ncbi:CE1759 family FMN reductase [Brachybacterium sp. EE-P12]|uniref:NAD(P)H-dependent oxidoreductase n=1 Tax=Candidatus Brachybacterium intestinipullorum TaxID=2838512 RepID=A0A9D2PYR4_9MICO|nr:CE1759 family FMN reductase [Brachybacterium sp. EE-P12]HJC69798.1 NAD(P)H-dependent oxidoreductase [Candidatus Brachybacterium intestinipullorum]
MTDTVRLVALSAGLSTPSSTRMLADQLSRAAAAALGRDGAEVEVTTVELREHAHDITDALLTRFPGERLSMVIESVRAADAVIAVTPVFNLGPSGLFKTFFDAIDIEVWNDKPVLLGATAGTARHSLAIDYAIRPLFGYLKAQVVPTAVFAASADLGADTEGQADEQPLAVRVRRAASELATMLRAGIGTTAAPSETSEGPADGAPAGATSTVDAEFSDFVPMGKLLGRG